MVWNPTLFKELNTDYLDEREKLSAKLNTKTISKKRAEISLLQVSREGIISRAEGIPLGAWVSDVASAIRIHEHDGGETRVHMPEDVAMEEPWTRVGGLEAEGRPSSASSGNITPGRVDEVYNVGAVGFDDPEVVTVEMDRVGIVIVVGGKSDINNLVPWEDEGVLSNVEVGGFIGTSKDLNESGNDRGNVGDVVDVPLGLAGGDYQGESDVDISGLSRVGDIGNERTEVSFNEFRFRGVDVEGSTGFFIGCAIIAKYTAREGDVEVRVSSSASTDIWEVNPVVTNGLVGIEDDGVTLASKDIETRDGVRLDFNTIGFDDGEVVLVDRHRKFATNGLRDDTKTVALAGLNFLDSEGDLGTAIEAASAVHDTGVGDRDKTSSNICVEQSERGIVPPISELDDGSFVVDVVQARMGILGIVDNEGSPKTVKILEAQLRVIPERASLVPNERNLVGEAAARSDWASGYERGTLIERIIGVEEDTVEVQSGTTTHGRIGELVVGGDSESISLVGLDQRARILAVCGDRIPYETIW